MKEFPGAAASGGIAVGRACLLRQETPDAAAHTGPGSATVWHAARQAALAELQALYETTAAADRSAAEIFLAHSELLQDEELDEMICDDIQNGTDALTAVNEAFRTLAELLRASKSDRNAQRAADMEDLRQRCARLLCGSAAADALPDGAVLVAHTILPSDVARFGAEKLSGIVTEEGSATSHFVILARGFGIPVVIVPVGTAAFISDNAALIVDGSAGRVIADPSPEQIAEAAPKAGLFRSRRAASLRYKNRPAVTADGERVLLGINIAGEMPVNPGQYDFVGLMRTEFLYLDAGRLPTEDEQFAVYRQILARQSGGQPLTLRTLDIGGDKTAPCLPLPAEANPFLGKRALRLCFDSPELFKTQLRAALRASAFGKLQIMFPMVGSLDDFRRAKAIVCEAMQELRDARIPFDESVRLGIMIEIPSIAMLADLAAREVDFASIGTNDLCQYFCAADRMNPDVAAYYQSLSPAFLRLLKQIITAFDQEGKEISMCGELAGDARLSALLYGLGLRKFSMESQALPAVKDSLSHITVPVAAGLAERCLAADTQAQVNEILDAASH